MDVENSETLNGLTGFNTSKKTDLRILSCKLKP